MRHASLLNPRLIRLLAVLVLLACAGCSSRVSTDHIRFSMASGDVDRLAHQLEETHENFGEMVTALNLGRVRQINGRWSESIRAYDQALELLEDYEQRAIVNVRGMAGSVGVTLLSRGADSYFGTGYERSLLHTFNALNYLMLEDFTGAAVEIRRMDQRQELWLEESQSRIAAHLDKQGVSDELPSGYSMRELLRDESVRRLLNNYQDAFSYALGAVIHRIAGDRLAADVSLRRAVALDPSAADMFAAVWPSRPARDGLNITVPPLPPLSASSPAKQPATQEVTLVYFTGIAPALGVENVRVPFPAVGYLLIDLPNYTRAVHASPPNARTQPVEEQVTFYPLLNTEALAYRTLSDELRVELVTAISRAAFRAGVSTTAYVAASSNKDTAAYAPLVGVMTTALMDLFSSALAQSVRNWETLPALGYLALTTVPRGSAIHIGHSAAPTIVNLPPEARGVIIVATQLSKDNLKVNYVTY